MIQKKAWEPYLLLVPLFEALVLPGIVERANNAEASRRICYTSKVDALAPNRTKYTYPLRHLPFAAFLTIPKKFTRFRRVKKERRVNAISLCFADPPRIARDRASAMRSATAKIIHFIYTTNIYKNFLRDIPDTYGLYLMGGMLSTAKCRSRRQVHEPLRQPR